jgi:50S ribosomal subunit-associated GTPase HflX
MVLIGNKNDLSNKREVSFETATTFAKQYKLDYIEVSALTGENIKFAYEVLTRNMAKVESELDVNESKKKSTRRSKLMNNDIDYASRNPFDTETHSVKIRTDNKKKNCCK